MDCLYMTDYMCSIVKNNRTILKYQNFDRFYKDFTKGNKKEVGRFLSYDKFKRNLNIFSINHNPPQIQRNNKNYFVIGYCNVTDYLGNLKINKQANNQKIMTMLSALKCFVKFGGAVQIGGKIYVKRHPITYRAIK